jgi:hypothetical protein
MSSNQPTLNINNNIKVGDNIYVKKLLRLHDIIFAYLSYISGIILLNGGF